MAVLTLALLATMTLATESRATPFIQGGQVAKEGEFPWMAWIDYGGYDEEKPGSAACTGTIVSPTVILTAGHCTEPEGSTTPFEASKFTVVTGSINRKTGPKTTVAKVITYPGWKYGGGKFEGHDAGILVLSHPITAPPISLAASPGDETLLKPGLQASVAGWGITSPTGLIEPEDLFWTTMSIECVGATECGSAEEQYSILAVNSSNKGTCAGDSGGPLWQETAGGAVEIGITSRGPAASCNQTTFTRVDEIRPWIEEQIAANAPEFGRCRKVTTKGTGGYENSGCTKVGGTKGYEWFPGPGAKPNFTVVMKPTTSLTPIKLETASKHVLICTGDTGIGHITGPRTATLGMTLSGCTDSGKSCTTFGEPGVVSLGTFEAELAWVDKSLNKAALRLHTSDYQIPEEFLFTNYNCEGSIQAWIGGFTAEPGILLPVTVSKAVPKATLKFGQSKGKQIPSALEGRPAEKFEEEREGATPAITSVGLSLTLVQTYEEPYEINGVL